MASSSSNVVGVHYRVGKKIGEGSFGVLFEGTNLLNNQQVAIKFVSSDDSSFLWVSSLATCIMCIVFLLFVGTPDDQNHDIDILEFDADWCLSPISRNLGKAMHPSCEMNIVPTRSLLVAVSHPCETSLSNIK